MFGIKTKKDKRIEELEERLMTAYTKPPQIITSRGNVISLGATQVLEDDMPADYAKQMLARKLVDEAVRFIHYDLEQQGTEKVLKGYIQVVTYGKE